MFFDVIGILINRKFVKDQNFVRHFSDCGTKMDAVYFFL